MTTVKFNKRLYRKAKKENGYTSDAQVAKATHIDRQTLWNVVHNNRPNVTVWVAWSIAQALHVEVLELFICKYEKDQ